MPRGQPANIGDVKVNRNGYSYTKTPDGWIGTHILIMEKTIGRKLEPGEYVSFKNGQSIDPSNLVLRKKGDHRSSVKGRIAQLEARIEQLQLELEHLRREERADQEVGQKENRNGQGPVREV